jgi:hypothetical protein
MTNTRRSPLRRNAWWIIILLAILINGSVLAACSGDAGVWGEYRDGYTVVPPTVLHSVEVYHNSGAMQSGDGWNIIWLAGDEFAYCVDDQHPEWITTLQHAVGDGVPFVLFYHDGGTSTGACHPGVEGVHKLRVTGIERYTVGMSFDQRALPESPSPYGTAFPEDEVPRRTAVLPDAENSDTTGDE